MLYDHIILCCIAIIEQANSSKMNPNTRPLKLNQFFFLSDQHFRFQGAPNQTRLTYSTMRNFHVQIWRLKTWPGGQLSHSGPEPTRYHGYFIRSKGQTWEDRMTRLQWQACLETLHTELQLQASTTTELKALPLGLPSNLQYKAHQYTKLQCLSSRLAVVFAQSIEARC